MKKTILPQLQTGTGIFNTFFFFLVLVYASLKFILVTKRPEITLSKVTNTRCLNCRQTNYPYTCNTYGPILSWAMVPGLCDILLFF